MDQQKEDFKPSFSFASVMQASAKASTSICSSKPVMLAAPNAAGSTTASGHVMVSAPPLLSITSLSSKPPPPPLIAVPSGTLLLSQGRLDASTTDSLAVSRRAPVLPGTGVVASVATGSSATSVDSNGGGKSGSGGGGLGSGKPKAFLALMTSTTKKQVIKKSPQASSLKPPNTSKGTKGQGSKSKGSPSGSTQLKKGEAVGPSRTSNRSIKRPRTYDEEIDDLKAVKLPSSKKSKGMPKVSPKREILPPTVEPLNKGHIWIMSIIPSREVVPVSEFQFTQRRTNWCILVVQRLSLSCRILYRRFNCISNSCIVH